MSTKNQTIDNQNINQKLDKILEFQAKQAKYIKIRFWISLILILFFFVIPLLLLPFALKSFISTYGNLYNSTELNDTLKLLN